MQMLRASVSKQQLTMINCSPQISQKQPQFSILHQNSQLARW